MNASARDEVRLGEFVHVIELQCRDIFLIFDLGSIFQGFFVGCKGAFLPVGFDVVPRRNEMIFPVLHSGLVDAWSSQVDFNTIDGAVPRLVGENEFIFAFLGNDFVFAVRCPVYSRVIVFVPCEIDLSVGLTAIFDFLIVGIELANRLRLIYGDGIG